MKIIKTQIEKFDPTNLKTVFLASLFWRFLVFSIVILGYFLLAEKYAPSSLIGSPWNKNFLFWSWANFDAEHFLHIAEFGYGYNRGLPMFSFFPLYPLMLRFLNKIFSDYFLVGQIIIFIFLPLTIYFLNCLLKKEGIADKKIWLIDLLFLFSPGAVFLNAFYTELPFLFFIIASLFFLKEKKYWSSALLGFLASATRVVGIFIAPAIFWVLLKEKKLSWSKKISFPLFSSLGLFCYSLFLKFKFANPLLFGLSHQAWGKAQIVSPFQTLINYLLTIFSWPSGLSWLNYYTVLIEFLITLTALISFIYLWSQTLKGKKAKPALAFSTLAFILPFLTGSLGTMPRYLLTFLSLFPFWANIFVKIKPAVRFFLLGIMFLVFSSGVILFTRGYWWG
ncbi:MAG: mannosyltransferase family protein [Patescibacteria group bacterium]|jgi:Gpi18-like mannosyltransferase